jgi:hypothetical protein
MKSSRGQWQNINDTKVMDAACYMKNISTADGLNETFNFADPSKQVVFSDDQGRWQDMISNRMHIKSMIVGIVALTVLSRLTTK